VGRKRLKKKRQRIRNCGTVAIHLGSVLFSLLTNKKNFKEKKNRKKKKNEIKKLNLVQEF